MPQPVKLFISYCHATPEHEARVAEFISLFRKRPGILCIADMDIRSPQGPLEGWPRWIQKQIDTADWVLVVCNKDYWRRFRGEEESGKGLGVTWEGAILTNELYRAQARNTKFIPAVFAEEDKKFIPVPLVGATPYVLPQDGDRLHHALTGLSELVAGEQASIDRLASDKMGIPPASPPHVPPPVTSVPMANPTPGSETGRELLKMILAHPVFEERGLFEILKSITPLDTYFIPNLTCGGSAPAVRTRLFRAAVDELIRLGWLFPPEPVPSHGGIAYELNPDMNQ